MASDDDDFEDGGTFSAAQLAEQRYEAAKSKGEILELSSDDEEELPQKRTRKRTRLEEYDDYDDGFSYSEGDDDDDDDDDDVVLVRVLPPKPRRVTGPTVAELKHLCRSRGLKVGGTKDQLVARLENPRCEDAATYRAPPRLKPNAQSQYFVNGVRVRPSEYNRRQAASSSGSYGAAFAQQQHRAVEAQMRRQVAEQMRAVQRQQRQAAEQMRAAQRQQRQMAEQMRAAQRQAEAQMRAAQRHAVFRFPF